MKISSKSDRDEYARRVETAEPEKAKPKAKRKTKKK